MDSAEPRLLIVDDNPAIYEDFLKIFSPPSPTTKALDQTERALFGEPPASSIMHKSTYRVDHASQGQVALHMVEEALRLGHPYAVAFVDMRMPPGWDGVETVVQLWKIDPTLQIVFCSAYNDYSWDDIQTKLGPSDNLLILKKPFDSVEVLQLAASLSRKWLLTLQLRQRLDEMELAVQQRTAELRHSEERFATAFRAAPLPQAVLNFATGQIVESNEAFTRLLGFTREELVSHSLPALTQTTMLQALRQPHPLQGFATTLQTKTGEQRQVLLSTQPTTLTGQPHLIIMAQDVTDERELEDRLRHAQKMEAVGQLAAGVAHDFNNILTIIQGHLSLQLATAEFSDESREALTETLQASERAASLTHQLLTFSRKHLYQPLAMDLNALLSNQTSMLQRIIGEHIEVSWECEDDLPYVMGDAPGISQIVMNLVINARDAMPKGGRLRIATGLIEISASRAAQNPESREGKFVRFSVTDNGAGMDAPTMARVFEPFFTTKDVGQGSGMGLATVYGIVKQHEGWIEAFSDVGQGSTFFVYLPVASDKPKDDSPSRAIVTRSGAGLSVLLVEDEPAVRSIMRQLLTHCGCRVIEAGDAAEGYQQWAEHKQHIDLLVTDIVMPGGATGHDLAQRLLDERPDLRVIYSSGYSADLFQQGSELVPGRNFLPKPYDASSVISMIRRVASERTEVLSS
jgi:two-component system, cell cycle sensor histidine kinase and response regulator CckA